ncbi:MAG: hypothetical protein K2K53_01555 [Oscillospiraceae bacterium]|nr:hypothetical protein [Oscillospiraceae bacterium]
MLRAKNIWVAGGDPRQAALAGLLADDGHCVHTYALEQAEGMRCEPSMDRRQPLPNPRSTAR